MESGSSIFRDQQWFFWIGLAGNCHENLTNKIFIGVSVSLGSCRWMTGGILDVGKLLLVRQRIGCLDSSFRRILDKAYFNLRSGKIEVD